jgi:hypothetical protein
MIECQTLNQLLLLEEFTASALAQVFDHVNAVKRFVD